MMTAATLLGTMVNRSLQLRMRLVTQVESHVIGLGDVTSVAKLVFIVTVAMELLTAAALAITIPLIAAFFVLQKYFIEGVTLTGVKG